MHSFCVWVEHLSWIYGINNDLWGSVVVEVAHFLGFFVLIGSMLIVDLRLLGLTARNRSATELASELFPRAWWGFAVVVFTGWFMFEGSVSLFYYNPFFYYMLFWVAVAAATAFFLQLEIRKLDATKETPVGTKILAGVSLLLWLGAILSAVELPAQSGIP